MVSNGAQFILMECEQKGYDLHKLYDHVVIQINDTHPSMVIPELIRLLQERGFTMQEAIDVVSKTCAYTNHTILAEALEKGLITQAQMTACLRQLNNLITIIYRDKFDRLQSPLEKSGL